MTKTWTVDILTTFCAGEPYEMIVKTLKAIQAINYPHTTYLCDEADDPYLRQVCEQLGVRHVTRTNKKDAKAGNINNALQQATGEICLVLDPDHVPVPDFLNRVLPYFEDPAIGFVQCVQAYSNRKKSLIAFGATEQTYNFYGPLMTCMGHYGTAQAIGANCTFRRAALDSIGGHAAGLSEDMHTAMLLHAKKWKSVYVPLPLSYGLVPDTMAAYCKQQLKWARGTLELLVTTYPRVFSQLTWRQRLHYLTVPLYYLNGIVQFINLLIPIFSLIMMQLPLKMELQWLALAYIPLLAISFLIRQYAQRWLIEKHEQGIYIIGGFLTSGIWWVYTMGFFYTLFRVDVPYLPTPKNAKPQNNFLLCLPNIIMGLVTLGAISYSIYYYGLLAINNIYVLMMVGFGLINAFILGMNVFIGQEKLLASVKHRIQHSSFRRSHRWKQSITIWRIQYKVYGNLRSYAVPLYGGLIAITTIFLVNTYQKTFGRLSGDVKYATSQPFYYNQAALSAHRSADPQASFIAPHHLRWPLRTDKAAIGPDWSMQPNELPLLYLEPALTSRSDTGIQMFLQDIHLGKHDPALTKFVRRIKHYNRPVLLAFAPFFDDTTLVWGTQKETLLATYRDTFRYLVRFCQSNNVTNVTWLWCPTFPGTISFFCPGKEYVDWIGLRVVNNPSLAPDKESHSFATLYQPLHKTIRRHKVYGIQQKPVLITELTTLVQPDQEEWQQEAFDLIQERYQEIRGVVINSPKSATSMASTLPTGKPKLQQVQAVH
ncbi:glycosyltransferase [Spirosoma sp. KNUC1025]|uniref:glycosyltransferase n=1 Tax=Spirosoma sp. KNUC1025 TaxID=2894082 RepID=UPI0038648236|nr:glycosyltransferase [Spirosoma sp. KNUC1025]